ncbi:MAG: DUF99 family protein [Thermoplasmataceae archaeon]
MKAAKMLLTKLLILINMKPNFRAVGIDDGSFMKGRDKNCMIAGVLIRADSLVESVSIRPIEVDGLDSTETIIEIVNGDFKRNASIIMAYGVTFGGFNVADLFRIFNATGIPVISITRKRPDLEAIADAIEKTQDNWRQKIDVMQRYSPEELYLPNRSVLFINRAGTEQRSAMVYIKKLTRTGNIPEPLRLANMIAKSIKK